MSIKFSRDAYELEDDSDQEGAESSDDDIDTFLHGALQQHRKKQCKRSLGQESSSEDEFEKEMAAELSTTMKKIEANHGLAEVNVLPSAVAGQKVEEYYDNTYFDSDSDDEGTSEEKKKVKHPVPSNDDLLYDPDMDDKDQQWVDRQRRQYHPVSANGATKSGGRVRPLPSSDAVLNCPGCMTLLCMDCQRHAVYQHQYRAMFVTNCTVRYDQTLRYPEPPPQKAKFKGKKAAKAAAAEVACMAVGDAAVDEIYHPVVCSICNSEVGVYDHDEVYHFFNILTSHT